MSDYGYLTSLAAIKVVEREIRDKIQKEAFIKENFKEFMKEESAKAMEIYLSRGEHR